MEALSYGFDGVEVDITSLPYYGKVLVGHVVPTRKSLEELYFIPLKNLTLSRPFFLMLDIQSFGGKRTRKRLFDLLEWYSEMLTNFQTGEVKKVTVVLMNNFDRDDFFEKEGHAWCMNEVYRSTLETFRHFKTKPSFPLLLNVPYNKSYKEDVQIAHTNGCEIVFWGRYGKRTWRKLTKANVDWLSTNNPKALAKFVGRVQH